VLITASLGEFLREMIFNDSEACFSQAVSIVESVESDMVALPIELLAIARAGDGIVLEGFVTSVVLRDLHDSPSLRLQDSVDLLHRFEVILDVFHDMVTDNHIIGVIVEGDVMDVEVVISQWGDEISCSVIEILLALEPIEEAELGRNVEYLELILHEVSLPLQIKPHKSMSL